MTKRALCIGVNQYPRSPLQGCVDDATSWAAVLNQRGFFVEPLHDHAATRTGILDSIEGMLEDCDRDSLACVTFSGHGTRAPDRDGDEVDGWDEALVAYPGTSRADLILDDDLYRLFAPAEARGVRVVMIADSCHSGTLHRLAPPLTERPLPPYEPETHTADEVVLEGGDHGYRKQRWLPPAEWLDPDEFQVAVRAWNAPRGRSRRSALTLSACQPQQVTYDAFIGGRYRGCFTAAALAALHMVEGPPRTYRQWLKDIRTLLPSEDFANVPQLDGTAAQKRRLIFDPKGSR